MSKLWYESPGGYFSLPRALRYDDRLSHSDIHVLIAIASYVFQKNAVFPNRESLHQFTGIEATNISKRTTRLAKFGWLCKSGKPGQKMTYTLTVPTYAANRMAEMNLRRIIQQAGMQMTASVETPSSIIAEGSLIATSLVKAGTTESLICEEEDIMDWDDVT